VSDEAARLRAAFDAIGIAAALPRRRRLKRHHEARRLVTIGLGTDGRDKFLVPPAALAWRALQGAAAEDGIELLLVSAFRSIDFQTALIRAKLARGMRLDEVLRVNAPPGYSEHHTGRAVDIGVAGCAALDEAFEQTPAFAWLLGHAGRFGFHLSYPRDNDQGYLYEPWHWCFRR
jgi:D-alanyl-D-alanine carboxypeptidase